MALESSVWIERIDVENLGPLGDRGFDLGPLNLFYGPNEVGKTYLVEFLLRSLFRQNKEWTLRGNLGQGKVTVRGLADNAIEFTPTSRRKLEDYWTDNDRGLPTNVARLLVVKGAELALDQEAAGGVDRSVLKSVLSSEGLLDAILGSIQVTVQGASIESGNIVGAGRGELKEREQKKADLERLESLFSEVEDRVSGGKVQSLRLHRGALETKVAELEQAKRHHAFELQEQMNDLKDQRRGLPDDQIEQLEQVLRDGGKADRELSRQKAKLEEARETGKHFQWVEQAVQLWEAGKLGEAAGLSWLWMGGGALALVSSLLFAVLAALVRSIPAALAVTMVAGSVIAFALGSLLISVYLVRTRRAASSAHEMEEKEEVKAGFEDRFGRNLAGLADLKTVLEEQREADSDARYLSGRVSEIETDRQAALDEVKRLLLGLTGEEEDQADWETLANEFKTRARKLDEEIADLKSGLDRLGVDPSDVQSEPAPVGYSSEALKEAQEGLAKVDVDLHAAEKDLENLKGEVIRETSDDMSTSWENVLAHLWEHRLQAEADYRHITAHILAQIGVTQVLMKLKEHEDERIRAGLHDERVKRVLKEATGRYEALDLSDGVVVLQSKTADYPMPDLSTGAKEQVLLAMRMGFASRLASGKPLFLILDDAFQHSDWTRRERLVESVLRMVDNGWQVTYLTMDDHLRDLFRTTGERQYPNEMFFFELS
jgi:hypothetical protein